jgi:dTMP kinase
MTQPTYSDGTPFDLSHKHPFIVFEGVDSSGKTTISKQVAKYYGAWWSCEPYELTYKDIILLCETPYEKSLLFATDRAYHCPYLEKELQRRMCISDRYYYSNLVYQSVLDKVPLPWLHAIQPPNLIKPDLIIFCTGDIYTILGRCIAKGETQWDYETLSKLQSAYHDVLKLEKHLTIDTTKQSIDECVAQCVIEIERLIK